MGGDCCRETSFGPPEFSGSLVRMPAIHIYGDYFDRDTRAILALCDMVEVPTKFHIVDTFNGGNLESVYV